MHCKAARNMHSPRMLLFTMNTGLAKSQTIAPAHSIADGQRTTEKDVCCQHEGLNALGKQAARMRPRTRDLVPGSILIHAPGAAGNVVLETVPGDCVGNRVGNCAESCAGRPIANGAHRCVGNCAVSGVGSCAVI